MSFAQKYPGDSLLEWRLSSLTILAPLACRSLTALFLSSSEVPFWNETITGGLVLFTCSVPVIHLPSLLPDAIATDASDSRPMRDSLVKLSIHWSRGLSGVDGVQRLAC